MGLIGGVALIISRETAREAGERPGVEQWERLYL